MGCLAGSDILFVLIRLSCLGIDPGVLPDEDRQVEPFKHHPPSAVAGAEQARRFAGIEPAVTWPHVSTDSASVATAPKLAEFSDYGPC